MPLARRIARVYEGRGEPMEDLCQAASVGLIKAVDQYSPERGDAFPAYARPMILGEVRRHFRDTTWRVHVSRPVKERAARVLRAEKELGTATRPAGAEAIADYLDLGPGEVAEARSALNAYWPESLDAIHVGPDGAALPLHEAIGGDEPGFQRVELSAGVRRALLTLKPRDQRILLLRLRWELSQTEIARHVGLSQMQVSRVLRQAGFALSSSCGLAVST